MVLATEQDILDTGILPVNHELNIAGLLNQAETRIIRLLTQTWWRGYLRVYRTQNPKLNPQLLNPEQWRECVAHYALAYVILPRLATLTNTDYNSQITDSHDKFENLYRHLMEFGFDYDVEGIERTEYVEPEAVDYLRMRQ